MNEQTTRTITKTELFWGFLKIGMLGFGGIAPIARHVIVEEKKWVSEPEFAAIVGIGQILPGANTVNAAVIIGDRFQGGAGVLVCLLAQLLVPILLVAGLGTLYAQYESVPTVSAIVIGMAAGAAGLVMGTGLKMSRKIKLAPTQILVTVAAFVAIGVLELPLVPVVLVLAPLSIALAALQRKN